MTLFAEALAWLADPSNWSGASGLWARIGEHLAVTAGAVGLAALLGLPLGVWVGHTRRGAALVGAVAGAARAVPTLGLLTIVGLLLGIGLTAPLVALVVLAVPSMLAGAYAGVEAVDPAVVDAARAQGMAEHQVVFGVELPLAAPVVLGGVRAATLQVVATATLAAYLADAGLGRFLFAGLKSRDYAQMLAAAIVVAVIALILELSFEALQRAAARRSRAGRTASD